MARLIIALLSCFAAVAGYSMENAEDSLAHVRPADAVSEEGSSEDQPESSYDFWKHRKFIRLGYTSVNAMSTTGTVYKDRFGVDFMSGKNLYLHKKPIAGMLKFAIDLGCSMNYTMYEEEKAVTDGYDGPSGYLGDSPVTGDGEDSDMFSDFLSKDHGRHRADVGMIIGPSLTVRPVSDMRVTAYWHFVPSVSFLILNSSIDLGWVPFMNYGLEVSYRWIGVGVERKYGIGNYWSLAGIADGSAKTAARYKLDGYSLYLAFRF